MNYQHHKPDAEIEGEPPKEEQAKIALHELRTLGGQITSEHE